MPIVKQSKILKILSSASWVCLIGTLSACGLPTALVGGFGYHVRGNEVFYTAGGGSQSRVSTSKVEDADGMTFQSLKGLYGKDQRSVFIGVYRMSNADAPSFEALNDKYARDKYNAYFLGFQIVGADSASFVVLPNGGARDLNRCYWQTSVTKCPTQ